MAVPTEVSAEAPPHYVSVELVVQVMHEGQTEPEDTQGIADDSSQVVKTSPGLEGA